ncbi:MAG: T9SS type A sorting domain-containing protein [Ignavibacteria bacterium]|nr:T9SS type A sorting domain-containing protein [Ignavibacteria bacterium]
MSVFLLSINFVFISSIVADPWGTPLGEYNGVICYSNGNTGYASNQTNYQNGTNTGMKWQCPEYINRYYVIVYSMNIRNQASNNANDYYYTATARGLQAFTNGGTTAPQVGNIVCSQGGDFGHVGLVRAVGSNYVDIIQQNWFNNSGDVIRRLSMTVSNGHYTIEGFSSSYPIVGWLRKAGSEGYGSINTGLTITPNPVQRTVPTRFRFTLKETIGAAILFEKIVITIKFNGNPVFELPYKLNVNLPANGTYDYDETSSQFGPGTALTQHTAEVKGYKNGTWFVFSTIGSGQNPVTFNVVAPPTEIKNITDVMPTIYSLFQNYPNPFNPETRIKFGLPRQSKVKLSIFNMSGKEITKLVGEQLSAGTYEVNFNASDFASGIYFYRIETESFRQTKRMILVK